MIHTSNDKMYKAFLLLIFCITFILYIPSLFAWYQADDFLHKMLFSDLSFGESLQNAITGNAYQGSVADKHYRPITNTLLWGLLKPDSFIYARIFVVLLHIANGFLIYNLFVAIRERSDRYNLWGVLFFLTAPVASHSLLYVSALGDSLTTTFSLMSMLIMMRYLQKRELLSLLSLNCCLFFALLSKEMAVSLPILIALFLWKKGSLKRDYLIPISMMGVVISFFIIRTKVLSTLVMGESYSGAFLSFGKETLLTLIRYMHKYTHPLSPSLVAESPVTLLLGLPLYLLLFSFLFPFSKKRVFSSILFFCVMVIAIGPVINIANPWYLYYPSVFMSLGVLYCSMKSSLPIKQYCFAMVILINSLITGYTCYQNYRVGLLNRQILAEVDRLDVSTIRLVNVPVTISNNLLTLPFASFVSFGMKVIYDKDVAVQYGSREVVHSVPKKIQFAAIDSDKISVVASKQAHFSLDGEPLEERMSYEIIEKNRLGKPIALDLFFHDSTKSYLLVEMSSSD